jgi:hypothetical protein
LSERHGACTGTGELELLLHEPPQHVVSSSLRDSTTSMLVVILIFSLCIWDPGCAVDMLRCLGRENEVRAICVVLLLCAQMAGQCDDGTALRHF